MSEFNIDETREWQHGQDARNDVVVPERPVSQRHWDRDETQVDAVPYCRFRPGTRN